MQQRVGAEKADKISHSPRLVRQSSARAQGGSAYNQQHNP